MKMVPVIDTFRNAPVVAPASTERETNMHKNFASLTNQILTAFEKFGFKEFTSGLCIFLIQSK
jgi:molecular chaperone GrpE (heat shock protein)